MNEKTLKYTLIGIAIILILALFYIFIDKTNNVKSNQIKDVNENQGRKISDLEKESKNLDKQIKHLEEQLIKSEIEEEKQIIQEENNKVIDQQLLPPYILNGSEETLIYEFNSIIDLGANSLYAKKEFPEATIKSPINQSDVELYKNHEGEVEEFYYIYLNKVFIYKRVSDDFMSNDGYNIAQKAINDFYKNAEQKSNYQ